MNTQLTELREKMIHDTEAFLDRGLQQDPQATQATEASSLAAPKSQPDPVHCRPYFFPTWHEWKPEPQISSA